MWHRTGTHKASVSYTKNVVADGLVFRGLLIVSALLPSLVDVVLRWSWLTSIDASGQLFYGMTHALTSLALACILHATFGSPQRHRRWFGMCALSLYAWFALGTQWFTFARHHAYLDADAMLVGTTLAPRFADVRYAGARSFWLLLPLLAIAILATVSRMTTRGETRTLPPVGAALDLGTIALLVLAYVAPSRGERQGRSPEALMLSAFGQSTRAHWDKNETILRAHPSARTPTAVSPLSVDTGRPRRNVLVILNESLRAASTCVSYDPNCITTPFSNAAAKDRIPLLQMRALDSTTAISLSVYLSGLLPTASRTDALSAPLAWEYAHAGGYQTAYYTSQNVLFGNQGKLIENVHFTRSRLATELESAPDLDTGADDGKAAAYAIADSKNLSAPSFSVVHFCNTHYPYLVDENDAPFQPQSGSADPQLKHELRNRYHDAVYHQDRAIAALVEHTKRQSTPTVIVYLSDHGEQLHEHHWAGHTFSVYDEEIRVPFWIWATPGALSEDEVKALLALREVPVFGIDVLPTLLDLMNLWDAPELARHKILMPGKSLLRGGSSTAQIWPLTNCTELWGCYFKNWGAMQGTRKVLASQTEKAPRCFDIAQDPEEQRPLPLEQCAALMPTMHSLGAL
jgi:glucan phosphoethanolaminetransferase (alkaline phosphatase superfamily)